MALVIQWPHRQAFQAQRNKVSLGGFEATSLLVDKVELRELARAGGHEALLEALARTDGFLVSFVMCVCIGRGHASWGGGWCCVYVCVLRPTHVSTAESLVRTKRREHTAAYASLVIYAGAHLHSQARCEHIRAQSHTFIAEPGAPAYL